MADLVFFLFLLSLSVSGRRRIRLPRIVFTLPRRLEASSARGRYLDGARESAGQSKLKFRGISLFSAFFIFLAVP